MLAKNNLARLVNGEFGKLKHRKTEKEIKAEQEEAKRKEAELNQPSELTLKIKTCSGKAQALDLIADYYSDKNLVMNKGKVLILPTFRPLIEKFDITDKEVFEVCPH